MTGVAVYATTDTASSPVGTTYPITVSGLVSQNYEIATVPGTLTIVAASSTTTLVAAQTTGFTAAQYGDTVTLTATVAPTTATGTVVFLEGQNVLGTAQVDSGTGVATLALTTLQAGRHTITADVSRRQQPRCEHEHACHYRGFPEDRSQWRTIPGRDRK